MNKIFILITFLILSSCKQEVKLKSSDKQCTLLDAQSNGWNINFALSSAGIKNFNDISSCHIDQCIEGFSINEPNTECVVSVRSCFIENGIGSQEWLGTEYSSCVAQSCSMNYELSANSCIPILCSIENSNLSNATAVAGDLVIGCRATACMTGYFLNNNVCEQLNCDPNFQYISGNTCADNSIIDAQLKFSLDYTKTLVNNVSKENTTNAKEVSIYSDNTCQNLIQDYMPISNLSTISLNNIEGNQSYYVKYKNGTSISDCVGDSIIYDKTAPSLNITYPIDSSLIAGENLTVTGICAELHPTDISINVKLNNESKTTSCNQGQFSSSFNISNLSNQSYNIEVSSSDYAENESALVQSFYKITCSEFQNTVGNDCIDKDILNAQLKFSLDYTKNLINSVSKENTTNAQEVAIYSDDTCQSLIQNYIPIAELTTITLNDTEGSQSYYARYKNGSAISECVGDSIIYDTTAPSLNITYPINSAQIAGENLTITGTCSELNPSDISINVKLNNETNNVSCEQGQFSSSFDISSLVNASYDISISASDLAENDSEVTQSFSKIICSEFQDTVGNNCVDKDILNPYIAFENMYTTSLTANSVSTGLTQYAQILEIHSEPTCSSKLQEYNMSSFNNRIDLPLGSDGSRTIYAIYKNGTKQSACLSAMITLDRENPSVSFNEIVDDKILTEQITVSGTCSDNISIQNIEISIGSNSSNVLCNSGSFSVIKDISSLSNISPNNEFKIDATIRDHAGNIRSISSKTLFKSKLVNISLSIIKNQFGKISSNLSGISCSTSSCNLSTLNNQTLTLSADLLSNGKFITWGGACSSFGTNPICTLSNLQSNLSISAEFDAVQYLFANNDNQSIQQGQMLSVNASTLLANDTAVFNQSFSLISVAPVQGGSVSLTGSVVSFTPNVLTGEPASFTYTIRDTFNKTSTATVNVNVTPLPEIQALIFDESEFDYINDLLTAAPPTLADLFASWGRFEERGAFSYVATSAIAASSLTTPGVVVGQTYTGSIASRFFENQQAAINARASIFSGFASQVIQGVAGGYWIWFEGLSWQFFSSPDRVESTVNSNNYIGFVSPKKYDNYELDATLKSTNGDDDTVSVVIAYVKPEGSSIGYTLSLARTQGGNTPSNGFGFMYNIGQTGSSLLSSKSVGGVYRNLSGAEAVGVPLEQRNGWSGKTSRVKVQRSGDIIKIFAGVWNNPDIDPASLLELDLNSDPRLAVFKGPQKYGFGAQSQANASFTDIEFSAGGDLNQNLVYDLENRIVYEYNATLGWIVSPVDFATSLGFPRTIYNPQTQKTYYIDADGNISLVD